MGGSAVVVIVGSRTRRGEEWPSWELPRPMTTRRLQDPNIGKNKDIIKDEAESRPKVAVVYSRQQ